MILGSEFDCSRTEDPMANTADLLTHGFYYLPPDHEVLKVFNFSSSLLLKIIV